VKRRAGGALESLLGIPAPPRAKRRRAGSFVFQLPSTDRLLLPPQQLDSHDLAASRPYTAGKEMLVEACRCALVIVL
jgi:hypothetical protein